MTIKQLSDEIGVDKQKVYRYIKKNHINEAHQENGVMYYDETVQMQIKQALSQNEAHHEAYQNLVAATTSLTTIFFNEMTVSVIGQGLF